MSFQSTTGSRDRRPLAAQVMEELRALVGGPEFPPGSKLPTEVELSERFSVGRTTVREALKGLENDGLVEAQQGRGRFVSAAAALDVTRPVTRYESVTEHLEALGYKVTTRVLEASTDDPSPEEQAALGLQPHEKVHRMRRLRLGGGTPLVYSETVVPASVVEGDSLDGGVSGSLVKALESAGHRLVIASSQIFAATLPPEIIELLGPLGQAPWLLIREISYTDAGRPLLYSHDYYDGARFSFSVARRRDGF